MYVCMCVRVCVLLSNTCPHRRRCDQYFDTRYVYICMYICICIYIHIYV